MIIPQWESAWPNLDLPKIEASSEMSALKLRHLDVFFTECKSVEIWLRYKHFSNFPNSKIIAGMLKNLAAHY